MTDKIGEPLVYELSAPGRCGVKLPEPDVPLSPLPEGMLSEGMLRDDLPLRSYRRWTWCVTICGFRSSTMRWTRGCIRSALAR